MFNFGLGSVGKEWERRVERDRREGVDKIPIDCCNGVHICVFSILYSTFVGDA